MQSSKNYRKHNFLTRPHESNLQHLLKKYSRCQDLSSIQVRSSSEEEEEEEEEEEHQEDLDANSSIVTFCDSPTLVILHPQNTPHR